MNTVWISNWVKLQWNDVVCIKRFRIGPLLIPNINYFPMYFLSLQLDRNDGYCTSWLYIPGYCMITWQKYWLLPGYRGWVNLPTSSSYPTLPCVTCQAHFAYRILMHEDIWLGGFLYHSFENTTYGSLSNISKDSYLKICIGIFFYHFFLHCHDCKIYL